MKHSSTRFLVALALVYLGLGCSNPKSDLDLFFKELDKELTFHEKDQVRKCREVACLLQFVSTNANPGFKQQFENMPTSITNRLDSIGISNFKRLIVFAAYSKKMNNEDFTFRDIEVKVKQYYTNEQDKLKESQTDHLNYLSNIAESNYNNYDEGDTLCLIFPIQVFDGIPRALYGPIYDPDPRDTLYATCILLDKRKHPKSIPYEFSAERFKFHVRIVHLSCDPHLLMSQEVKSGDEIEFDLYHLKRPILPCGGNSKKIAVPSGSGKF